MGNTREASYAGSWYPGDEKSLVATIDGYLEKADTFSPPRKPRALISPHAGYVYSGSTAAFGYGSLKEGAYRTVVVLAPSHRVPLSGVAPWKSGAYETPLGLLPIDEEFCEQAMGGWELANESNQAHRMEHSLEMQIPFLQHTLGDFKLVPIIIGTHSLSLADELAQRLFHTIGERDDVLVVASTDLSHFHRAKEAESLDGLAANYIEKIDAEGLYDAESKRECELCGIMPVTTVLKLAKMWQNIEIKVLSYTHSGMITGDNSSVVGYLSAVIY